jgi:hypothetical protein
MTSGLQRYDPEEDELVPVTQEWVHEIQQVVKKLSLLRAMIHEMTAPGKLWEKKE